jgi:hypothetical protein
VRRRGEPGHVRAGLGKHVLGRAALPARHRLGLLQLLFPRREQFLDHGTDPVDTGVLSWLTILGSGQSRRCDLQVLGSLELNLRTNPGP